MSENNEIQTGYFPTIPKQARALEKRQALLKSGNILFAEKGYENTTAKEIASHAGVATGTFYRYFSDKRQLLLSLLKDKLESMMPPEPNWLNVDPESSLAILLKAHFERLDKLGLYRVLPELLHRDEELAEVLFEAKRKIYMQILKGLEQVKENGFAWEDLSLETLSWSIIALVEKIPEIQNESGSNPDYDQIAKIICRLVFPPEKMIQLKNLKREE
ncbi:TetR/AcrR family transcriptional regulator [Robertmurraya andreesenii]|uniref:AcrR family transcriptional regulator n=1 Tax=Anoxybacillus andreesenii TaxID=1325932 RepID=A0ABT9V0Y8_9BACL|nr:TetR/AcrR family transcriptional regulator [Robertmurraya andreesenii]MDQ0154576.1 AcrR family transcriptional regulator [Robertmurraya andreesenii]